MKIFSVSILFIIMSLSAWAERDMLSSETIDRILLSSDPTDAKVYFQSGDVIAFSLRKGRTPKFVQSITQSPFDHLGLLLWEADQLYIYEFLLNKGVKKSLLRDRINTYADHYGKTHFLVASTNQEWKPKTLQNLKNYLDSQVRLELKSSIRSCTDLLEKSLQFQNYTITIDENMMKNHLKRLNAFDRFLGAYKKTQIEQALPPAFLISALTVRFGTLTQLFWTQDAFLSAWNLSDFTFLREPPIKQNSCLSFYGGIR